jgi:hypothetical protein
VPLNLVPGVGKINEFILKGLGVQKCSDLIFSANNEKACRIFVNFSETAFDHLFKECSGMSLD